MKLAHLAIGQWEKNNKNKMKSHDFGKIQHYNSIPIHF